MRKIYSRLFIPVFVFAMGLLIRTNLPGGKLLAVQAGAVSGTSSSQGNSSETDSYGVGSGQGSNDSATGTQDSTRSGAITPNQSNLPASGNDSDQGKTPDQQAPGTPGATVSGNTGTAPLTNQAKADTDVTRSFGWGSLVGSFIVGLIIGGLIFGTRRPSRIDRDNIRRAA